MCKADTRVEVQALRIGTSFLFCLCASRQKGDWNSRQLCHIAHRQPATAQVEASHDDGVFADIAKATSREAGRAWVFIIALVTIILWAVSGPVFHYSDTWQLVINTGTTIITFLMVFLIQNSQNRDSTAIQVKLDELIRVSKARNTFIGLEDLTEEELVGGTCTVPKSCHALPRAEALLIRQSESVAP